MEAILTNEGITINTSFGKSNTSNKKKISFCQQEIMKMFKTEELYIQYMRMLWILRGLARNHAERSRPEGYHRVYYYDENDKMFFLMKLSNNIIGVLLFSGYDFSEGYDFSKERGRVDCLIREKRPFTEFFLTDDEAKKLIAKLKETENLKSLHTMRAMFKFAANDSNNPNHIVYEFADRLIFALTGGTSIIED